jgi:hypothetical protein
MRKEENQMPMTRRIPELGGITTQQEAFCQAIAKDPIEDRNAAALAAGYKQKNAKVQACYLMKDPVIQNRIKEIRRQILAESGYSPDMIKPLIMKQLVGQATTDLTEVVEVIYPDDERRKKAIEQHQSCDGQYLLDFGQPLVYVRPTDEWTPEQKAAVKTIEPTKDGLKVTMYDKMTAIKVLADMAGLTKSDLNLNLSVTDSISEARQRALESIGITDPTDSDADSDSEPATKAPETDNQIEIDYDPDVYD